MKPHVAAGITLALTAASFAASAALPIDLLGESTELAAANRTIVVDARTRWINVSEGEIVKFESNGRSFAWKFDGPIDNFSLNQVAPQGVLDHAVRVQVYPLSDA